MHEFLHHIGQRVDAMELNAELHERPGHHQQGQHRQQAPADGQHRGGRQVRLINL